MGSFVPQICDSVFNLSPTLIAGDFIDFVVNDFNGIGADSTGLRAAVTFEGPINRPPEVNDQAFSVLENTANDTVVDSILATDPDPGDTATLTFVETGGTGAAAFDVVPGTGEIKVADSSQLDYENTTSFTLEVQVTDSAGAFDTATITINVLNVQATISGTVFVDADGDGLFDGGTETAIDGVTVELLELDTVFVLLATDVTELGGVYAFTVDDEKGTYRIRETQPTGVNEGAGILGDADGDGITGEVADGTVLSSNEMQLTLTGIDAEFYDFTEAGQAVQAGDTATISFWQNKNGQALIIEAAMHL